MSKLLEIAKKIATKTPPDGQWFADKSLEFIDVDQLNRIDAIMNRVADTREKIEDERIAYQSRLGQLNKELGEIQGKCRHEVTTYHGDPSGGRDSYRACEICGREL